MGLLGKALNGANNAFNEFMDTRGKISEQVGGVEDKSSVALAVGKIAKNLGDAAITVVSVPVRFVSRPDEVGIGDVVRGAAGSIGENLTGAKGGVKAVANGVKNQVNEGLRLVAALWSFDGDDGEDD